MAVVAVSGASPGLPNRWVIASATMVMNVTLGSALAWSVFRDPLMTAYGWSLLEVTLAFTLANLSYLGVPFLGGLWLGRVGPRTVGITAGLINGLGIALSSLAGDRLWVLYLTFGILGGTGRTLGYIVPVATLVKWFPDQRGLLSGLALGAYSAGALIAAPALTLLIAAAGVQVTMLVLGLTSLLLVVSASCLLENPPEGYRPAGWVPSREQLAERSGCDYTVGEALRTWQWYALWFCMFVQISAALGFYGHAAPMAQELTGVDALAAAGLVSLIALMVTVGRFGLAPLSDVVGRKTILIAQSLVSGIALLLIPFATTSWAFGAATCVVLLSFGGNNAVVPSMTADYFGPKHVGPIFGAALTSAAAAAVCGPLLFAYSREAFGSYSPAFLVMAGWMLMSLTVAAMLRPPGVKEATAGPSPAPGLAAAPSAVTPAPPSSR
ncbi:MAG: OFA family MFS transporter [Chloroflexi bacterium]|nr:OFA family MFS transporter [Chloroflexota bacterium]